MLKKVWVVIVMILVFVAIMPSSAGADTLEVERTSFAMSTTVAYGCNVQSLPTITVA